MVRLPSQLNQSLKKKKTDQLVIQILEEKKNKWNESGMFEYQTQSADILSELMSNFDEPIFIPVLSEMISNALVISAEENFECSQSTQKTSKKPTKIL